MLYWLINRATALPAVKIKCRQMLNRKRQNAHHRLHLSPAEMLPNDGERRRAAYI